MAALLSVILGYVVGSFPSAYFAGRVLRGVDIRELGDGNPGAANAFRELGPWAGIAVAVMDAGKGAVAIMIAKGMAVPEGAALLAGLAAVAGHNWPILLQFRGGMGESTTIGVLLALVPSVTPIGLGIAVLPLLLSRNVTFASVFLFVPLPFIAWRLDTSGILIAYIVLLPCLVGFTHLVTAKRKRALALGKKRG